MTKASDLVKPEPPAWLTEEARAEWERVAALPFASELGVMDLPNLAVYCSSWARFVQAEREISANGAEIILRNDKGEIKSIIPSPWVQVGAKARVAMQSAWKALPFRLRNG